MIDSLHESLLITSFKVCDKAELRDIKILHATTLTDKYTQLKTFNRWSCPGYDKATCIKKEAVMPRCILLAAHARAHSHSQGSRWPCACWCRPTNRQGWVDAVYELLSVTRLWDGCIAQGRSLADVDASPTGNAPNRKLHFQSRVQCHGGRADIRRGEL